MVEKITSMKKPLKQVITDLISGGLDGGIAVNIVLSLNDIMADIVPTAYICSPLHADTAEQIFINMSAARVYEQQAKTEFGCKGLAPHAYLPMFLNDNVRKERKTGLKIGINTLKTCDYLFVCGNRITAGMIKEIQYAARHGIPIVYFNYSLAKKVAQIAQQASRRAITQQAHCMALSMPVEMAGMDALKK